MHLFVSNRFLRGLILTFSSLKKFVLGLILVLNIIPYYVIAQTSIPVERDGIISVPDAPNPHRFVNDYANVLTESEEQTLEEQLIAIDRGTSVQIAVVTLNTTLDVPLTDYAHQLFQKWGIGQKGKDNGLLLTVAISDRKSEITVGYGLEGAVTDANARHILQNVLRPYFKDGKYYSGLMASTDSLYKLTLGLYQFSSYGPPEEKVEEKETNFFISIWDFIGNWPTISGILLSILMLLLRVLLFLVQEVYFDLESSIAHKIGGSYLEKHKIKLVRRKERELERKNRDDSDSYKTPWASFRSSSGSFSSGGGYRSSGYRRSGGGFGGGRSGGGGASGSW